jgi:hypothetical protein
VGDRGPTPRREAERRRTNKPKTGVVLKLGLAELQNLPFEIDYTPEPPDPMEEWPDVLIELWEALKVDPLRKWMTSADWALTKVVMQITSDAMTQKSQDGSQVGINGAQQSALLKHMASIGVTEQARLRLQKEITLFPTRQPETEAEVTDIDEARRNSVQ